MSKLRTIPASAEEQSLKCII